MMLVFLFKLWLICSPLVAAHRRELSPKSKNTVGHGMHGFSFLCNNWPSHLSAALRRCDEPASIAAKKSLDKSRTTNDAIFYTGRPGFSLLGGREPTRSSWPIKAYGREGIPLRTTRDKVAQLAPLPRIITKIANPIDYITEKLPVLQPVRDALSKVLYSPGAYLERQCWTLMASVERVCRQLITEAHIVYLKACNVGISGLLTLGHDPVENIIRIIGLSYVVEWFTKSNYLRMHFDMNPMEIFTKGQYYRLLTSLFLHNGIVHMLHNVRSLLALGSETTRLLGPARMITIYLASGVIANYLSYVYHFAYKNGLPSDVFNMAQSVVQGVGQTGKSTYSLVEQVVDRIRGRQAGLTFPVFLVKYLNASLFHMVEGAVRSLLPHAYKSRQYAASSDVESSMQSYLKRKTARSRGCGASSAIYGLMGAICAYHLRFGGAAEKARVFEIITNAITQNLMALAGANVDHVSHLFGFLTGLGLTLQM